MSKPTFTIKDLANATKYASSLFISFKIKEYFKKLNIELEEKLEAWDKNLVQFLKKDAKLEPKYSYTFTKDACKKLACFDYEKYGKCLTYTDDGIEIKDPSNTYRGCQSICEKMTVPIDTVWSEKENKCLLVNAALKIFCLIPAMRQDTRTIYNKTPPFFWNGEKNICENSERYCNYFGMQMVNNKCDEQTGFKVSKFLFGQTVTRMISNAVYFQNSRTSTWDPPKVSAPSKERINQCTQFTKRDEKEDEYYDFAHISSRIAEEIGKTVLEYLAIDYGAKGLVASISIVSSMLPNISVSAIESVLGASTIVSTIFEFITTNETLLFVADITSVAFQSILTILNPIFILLFVVNVAGLITDQIDPLHIHSDLKYFISNDSLQAINELLNDKYTYNLTGKQKFSNLLEILPAVVWYANEKVTPSPEQTEFIIKHSAHYLSSLQYNSSGQELDFSDESNVQKIDIKLETHHIENIIPNVKHVFDSPDFIVKSTCLTSACISLISLCLYIKTFYSIFAVIILFCIFTFSFTILMWWTNSYKIEKYIFN